MKKSNPAASPLVLYALRYRSGYWATPINSPIPLLFAEKEDAERMAAATVQRAGPDEPLHFENPYLGAQVVRVLLANESDKEITK